MLKVPAASAATAPSFVFDSVSKFGAVYVAAAMNGPKVGVCWPYIEFFSFGCNGFLSLF